ncbi:50S ribosomal protein L17 [Patescibacteria group bacterium]
MRHRVATKTLHRDKDHRNSLVKNLCSSLVMNEKIKTTEAKAKFIRPKIEKLITRAKKGGDFNNVKYMKRKLIGEDTVRKILTDLGPRFKDVAGGYTRIVKIGNRDGDNAPMARIEFTKKPVVKKKEEKKKIATSAGQTRNDKGGDKVDKKKVVKKEGKR